MAERDGTWEEVEKGSGEADTGGADEKARDEFAGVEEREGGEMTSEPSGGRAADCYTEEHGQQSVQQ